MTEQTTTIAQLLAMPVGSKTGGFELSVKTFKKTWPVDKIWYQQVILMDKTGEIPADVCLGEATIPNTRPGLRGHGNIIRIIVCEVQEAEYLSKDRKKLLVHEYTIPTMTVGEYEVEQEALASKWDKEIEGKIRHGHSCQALGGLLKSGKTLEEAINEILASKKLLETLIKYITTGE